MSVTIRAAGSSSVLIDCGDLEGALGVFAALSLARDRGALEVDDLVPAAETVLVAGGEARDQARAIPRLRRILTEGAGAARREVAAAETVIPVTYRGVDLEEVAGLTGMSPEQVVARHSAPEYTVAFTGFAPGFAYLSGGDPALNVPRRSTPRPRIEPGSVGLAGRFSGVYPRASPGGWQIIGHTDYPMWDVDREQPAALIAGGRVRFRPERERVSAGSGSSPPAQGQPAPPPRSQPQRCAGSPRLRIVDPGLQSLVEDAGRPGVSGMGVGGSGAAPRRAYRLANRLVGNRAGAAALELGHGGFAAEALGAAVIALTGAERSARISGPYGERAAPHAAPFRLSAGEHLTLGPPLRGLRTMLGIRGGVSAPEILGSRSRDTLAGLGPEPLAAGDEIFVLDDGRHPVSAPWTANVPLPAVGEETAIRVVLGPRDGWFTAAALTLLSGESWEVTPRSDRVGARLSGSPLTRAHGFGERELPSEGMPLGAIQVPPDGQPVLFLADRPLTGGYPVIAVVHDDDLELAAQLVPGCLVRFVPADPGPGAPHAPNHQSDFEQETSQCR